MGPVQAYNISNGEVFRWSQVQGPPEMPMLLCRSLNCAHLYAQGGLLWCLQVPSLPELRVC